MGEGFSLKKVVIGAAAVAGGVALAKNPAARALIKEGFTKFRGMLTAGNLSGLIDKLPLVPTGAKAAMQTALKNNALSGAKGISGALGNARLQTNLAVKETVDFMKSTGAQGVKGMAEEANLQAHLGAMALKKT